MAEKKINPKPESVSLNDDDLAGVVGGVSVTPEQINFLEESEKRKKAKTTP